MIRCVETRVIKVHKRRKITMMLIHRGQILASKWETIS